MKNPIKTSKDKIIDALEAEEIKACCPDGNIPNSRVANQIDLARGNAALKYAKSQNRPVRRAKMGECEFSRAPLKPQYVKVDANKPKGMLSTEEAAEKIGVKTSVIRYFNKCKNVDSVKIGQRIYFPESSIAQLASFARTSA